MPIHDRSSPRICRQEQPRHCLAPGCLLHPRGRFAERCTRTDGDQPQRGHHGVRAVQKALPDAWPGRADAAGARGRGLEPKHGVVATWRISEGEAPEGASLWGGRGWWWGGVRVAVGHVQCECVWGGGERRSGELGPEDAPRAERWHASRSR